MNNDGSTPHMKGSRRAQCTRILPMHNQCVQDPMLGGGGIFCLFILQRPFSITYILKLGKQSIQATTGCGKSRVTVGHPPSICRMHSICSTSHVCELLQGVQGVTS